LQTGGAEALADFVVKKAGEPVPFGFLRADDLEGGGAQLLLRLPHCRDVDCVAGGEDDFAVLVAYGVIRKRKKGFASRFAQKKRFAAENARHAIPPDFVVSGRQDFEQVDTGEFTGGPAEQRDALAVNAMEGEILKQHPDAARTLFQQHFTQPFGLW
jgi:hypothetical protein